MKIKYIIYFSLLVLFNIILSFLALKNYYRHDDMYIYILYIMMGFLILSAYFFGFKKYLNLIFTGSLLFTFTLYSYTGSLYYSEYHDKFIFFSDIPNTDFVSANILLALSSGFIILLLSQIKKYEISKYSQLLMNALTLYLMMYFLYFVFWTDM